MKTKLMKIGFLTVVAIGFITLAVPINSLAAPVPNENPTSANQRDAILVIADCLAGNENRCLMYKPCVGSDAQDTAVCQAVRQVDGKIPALSSDVVNNCRQKRNAPEECRTAWATCIQNSLGGIVSAEEARRCNTLVSQGKLTDARLAQTADTGNNGSGEASAGNNTSEPTTCFVNGVGWIVCPVMSFLGWVTDSGYTIIESFLEAQPLMTTGANQQNSTLAVWGIFRNIANVVFVIMFLVIIFSQLTGAGMTNYGVKKMIPRLVIAAVLVNISYFICAIAVDLSNIIGSSLKGLFDSIGLRLQVDTAGAPLRTNAEGWQGIVGAVLGGAALSVGAAYGTSAAISALGFSTLLPALIAAVMLVLATFIVLALRQALIILLAVISPLAFVAYLLPNTESLFQKWRKLFQALLLMYPIIALMFGASALASQVVLNTVTGLANNPAMQIATIIMAAFISVAPLIFVPFLMKTTSGVIGRVGDFISNPNRGITKGIRQRAGEFGGTMDNFNQTRALRSQSRFRIGRRAAQRQARQRFTKAYQEEHLKNAELEYVNNELNQRGENGEPSRFAKVLGGGSPVTGRGFEQEAVDRAVSNVQFRLDKVQAEEVQAAHATIDNMDESGLQEVFARSSEASEAKKAAALQRLIAISNPEKYQNLVNQYGHDDSPATRMVRLAMAESLAKEGPKFLKAVDIDKISRGAMGNQTLGTMAAENVKSGVLSQERMVSDNNANLRFAYDVSDDEGKAKLRTTAEALVQNPYLKGNIKHNQAAIQEMQHPDEPPVHTASYTQENLNSMSPRDIGVIINNAGGPSGLSSGDIDKLSKALVNVERPVKDLKEPEARQIEVDAINQQIDRLRQTLVEERNRRSPVLQ